MPSYTTTEFLASVKRRGSIPTAQQQFGPTDILAFADDEISTKLLPLIISVKEGYYRTSLDLALTGGQDTYSIPTRAIGSALGDLRHVDTAGNERPIDFIQEEQRPLFNAASGNSPYGFYFQGNNVVVVPKPQTTDGTKLRLPYLAAPNNLVATTAAAQVQSINSGLNQITFTAAPPPTFSTGVLTDFIKAQPGFDSLAIDQQITGVSGNVVTFATTPPSTLAVGDWVSLAGESPVVQLPKQLIPILAQCVAIRVLRALGHTNQADRLEKELGTKESPGLLHSALSLISPRVVGEPKKIMPRQGVLSPQWQRNWLTKY